MCKQAEENSREEPEAVRPEVAQRQPQEDESGDKEQGAAGRGRARQKMKGLQDDGTGETKRRKV